jgi:hypothetical protein
MEKLNWGQTNALSFEEGSYVDRNGQKHPPLIRFSDDVLLNVAAEVGGKVVDGRAP